MSNEYSDKEKQRGFFLNILMVCFGTVISVSIVGSVAYVRLESYKRDAVIEADAVIETTRIEQDEKTERLKSLVPWSEEKKDDDPS